MSKLRATLAQLVEHLIRNERVAGSIPAGGSKRYIQQRIIAGTSVIL